MTYMRIYIEGVGEGHLNGYYLFKKGATKLNIKQKDIHPYNIYRTIKL